MILEHQGERPEIHDSAYIAPNATICGNVTIGRNVRVLFGAVISGEGGPIDIDVGTIVMEHSVLRGTPHHPLSVGRHVLVGPRAYLTGCTIEADSFLATGCTVFNGATIGRGSEIRINGVVHLRSSIPAGNVVPIGWVAVGDPAEILPPEDHERIWEQQEPLDFPGTVFGLDREPLEEMMPNLVDRYGSFLQRHAADREL